MLKGLSLFADRFAPFPESYIVIGGTACYLNLQEAGLEFRATKDIDIVLCVEALTPAFYKTFWEFIRQGEYQIHQRNDGKPSFYRFSKPINPEFPTMLELFSRNPSELELAEGSHLTPLPSGDETSSLSAILMNEEYYSFLHAGTEILQEITVARPEYLIPLKIKAWLDLSERRSRGESVDSRNITKHLKDIAILFNILDPEVSLSVSAGIAHDLTVFLEHLPVTDEKLVQVKKDILRFYRF